MYIGLGGIEENAWWRVDIEEIAALEYREYGGIAKLHITLKSGEVKAYPARSYQAQQILGLWEKYHDEEKTPRFS